ncbi:flagellar motor protein B [Candidatus Scalindua japonica]|uniref:Flagellar motor protein B n=1 Tax=Candidatus Scalindua japonica TaxID=1284222 RepID=A0A286U3T1_9BACT|nr:OmpA family protein [Candidatus Scalindua japonica]GAX62810.1 flagellar motor protein B [Candidatus Scalindua japonica]
MSLKSGFVKCFFLSLIVLFAGCAELTSLREEKTLMTQRIDELQNENNRLSSQNNSLSSQFSASKGENARLIAEKNRLENTRRSMSQRLGGTGASVKVKDGHISVVMPSSVLFNSGQTKLKESAKTSLTKVCSVIKKDFPNETIRIEGHTDSDPIKRTKQVYNSNWELSAKRAATVLHYLIDTCHLDPQKLYLAGFGKYQPVASNKNKSGKKKNRRVEIVVLSK